MEYYISEKEKYNKNMKFKPLYALMLSSLLVLGSCANKKDIVYLQDVQSGAVQTIGSDALIKLAPQDKISIIVKSKDATLADLFNLPAKMTQIGTPSDIAFQTPQGLSVYTVDNNGKIDFPILGKIDVAGKTRIEVGEDIKSRLLEGKHLREAVVTVEYANLSVSVMGEVQRPGRYAIERDKLTLLEALGMAGDLTIYGQRNNILVIREEHGQRKTYRVDLRRAEDLYASPAYYIKQNDLIYVEPNSFRVGQSTVNGNNVLSTSFWISLASLATTIGLFFLRR